MDMCLNTSVISWKRASKLNTSFFLFFPMTAQWSSGLFQGFIYRHFSKISFDEELYRLISMSDLPELNLHIFTYFEWPPRIASLITITVTFFFFLQKENTRGYLRNPLRREEAPIFHRKRWLADFARKGRNQRIVLVACKKRLFKAAFSSPDL